MTLRWFSSKAVREAVAMRKHVQRLVNAQRDLLAPQAIGAIQLKINELNAVMAEDANKGRIRIKTEELQFAADKWLKPYPNPLWRENVEVLLVALAVAMGIRTFFLQPFKIPTGSMQPTLYGVTSVPDFSRTISEVNGFEAHKSEMSDDVKTRFQAKIQTDFNQQLKLQQAITIPTGWERIKEWFEGISYVHVVAPADGTIDSVSPMRKFLIFNIKQTISIGGVPQTIWFPPDFGEIGFGHCAPASLPGHVYQKGEDVVKMEVHAGDHLFVDRLTYNFRQPERGEIVVFETKGIPEDQREMWHIPANEFYIKRLVGLGGETISLKQDYEVTGVPQFNGESVPVGHLVVNGQPLSASTPHFEDLYSFSDAPVGTKTLAVSGEPLLRSRDDSGIVARRAVSNPSGLSVRDGRQHDEQPRLAFLGRLSRVQCHRQDRFLSIGRSPNDLAWMTDNSPMNDRRNGFDHRRFVGNRPGTGEMFCGGRQPVDSCRPEYRRAGKACGGIASQK